jgi:hypothetical protein
MGLRPDDVGEGAIGLGRKPPTHQIGVTKTLGQREGVVVAVGRIAIDPAVEARTLLEGGIALAHQRGFGQADPMQGGAHARPGAFADANGRQVGRLDQADLRRVGARAVKLRGHGGGHDPPR